MYSTILFLFMYILTFYYNIVEYSIARFLQSKWSKDENKI